MRLTDNSPFLFFFWEFPAVLPVFKLRTIQNECDCYADAHTTNSMHRFEHMRKKFRKSNKCWLGYISSLEDKYIPWNKVVFWIFFCCKYSNKTRNLRHKLNDNNKIKSKNVLCKTKYVTNSVTPCQWNANERENSTFQSFMMCFLFVILLRNSDYALFKLNSKKESIALGIQIKIYYQATEVAFILLVHIRTTWINSGKQMSTDTTNTHILLLHISFSFRQHILPFFHIKYVSLFHSFETSVFSFFFLLSN